MHFLKKFIFIIYFALVGSYINLYSFEKNIDSTNIKVQEDSESKSSIFNKIKKSKYFIEITESSKIFALSIAAAVVYGLVNDQVTVRICPEYFTQGFHKTMVDKWHKNNIFKKILLNTKSNTVIGAVWGIVATWWMGAILGIPVIASARIGNLPKLDYKDLIKPTIVGVSSMFATSFVAGVAGYFYGKNKTNEKLKNIFARVSNDVAPEVIKSWVIDSFAHSAAYASGATVALSLVIYIIYKRYKLDRAQKEKAKMKETTIFKS